ncbi:hypothetical protein S7711_02561 [Stachybotrys chartarum IBT 7711]|uniref:Uncharacterized protein n=1 Tax=Stachybotrys chartarum (strain CBS 109288 / IBT 7711) TaxID=1280523 RepID=A0A084B5F0_STACB|nr:hypothetical protein S7711_02561 [Stachybotrys chartarum IBT 7711]KFA50534.1 hypothetical protein S40293_03042 [Stachybotrys chartarum IBT 40293]KFA73740.1 hypothetical protein S40288_06274 [Stachybotrys chartarum IBT 40288]
MCRMVAFAGSCTRCEESYTWDDLTQQLACLEAKNNDAFGSCKGGVFVEQHDFDQECDRCAEEDEGVGDVGDEEEQHTESVVIGKRTARDDQDECQDTQPMEARVEKQSRKKIKT